MMISRFSLFPAQRVSSCDGFRSKYFVKFQILSDLCLTCGLNEVMKRILDLPLKQKGSILILALIFLAAAMVAFSTLFLQIENLSRSNANFFEKSEAKNLSIQLKQVLNTKSTCSCALAGHTFDSSVVSIGDVALNPVKSDCAAGSSIVVQSSSPLPNSQSLMAVSAVSLTQIKPSIFSDVFLGTLKVKWNPSTLTYPMKDLEFKVSFKTDPTSPASAKTILSCSDYNLNEVSILATQMSIHVSNPVVSSMFTFEPGYVASDWSSPLTITSPLQDIVATGPLNVALRLDGYINWDGCSHPQIYDEPKLFQVALNYSLDGGGSYVDAFNLAKVTFNGGGTFVVSRVLNLVAGQVLRVRARARFEQVPTLPLNCVSSYNVLGHLRVVAYPP